MTCKGTRIAPKGCDVEGSGLFDRNRHRCIAHFSPSLDGRSEIGDQIGPTAGEIVLLGWILIEMEQHPALIFMELEHLPRSTNDGGDRSCSPDAVGSGVSLKIGGEVPDKITDWLGRSS